MVNVTVVNQFENVTDLQGLLAIPNATTGGFFWIGMLFMEVIIIMLSFLGFGFEVAVMTASFVGLITGLFLLYLNLISWTWLLFFLGMILFMIFYMVWQKK